MIAVADRAVIGLVEQARGQQFITREALIEQMAHHRVVGVGSQPKKKSAERLVGDATSADVVPGIRRVQQHVVVVDSGCLVRGEEPLVCLLLLHVLARRSDDNADAVGEATQGFDEGQVFHLHEEREDIAAFTAAEAMPAAGAREDDEGRRLLGVERAQRFERVPGLFEGDVARDEIDHVDARPHLLDRGLHHAGTT